MVRGNEIAVQPQCYSQEVLNVLNDVHLMVDDPVVGFTALQKCVHICERAPTGFNPVQPLVDELALLGQIFEAGAQFRRPTAGLD